MFLQLVDRPRQTPVFTEYYQEKGRQTNSKEEHYTLGDS